NIPANAKWAQSGVTIAGGNGYGGATNQLYFPLGLIIDDDQTVVIADNQNDRIMQWKNSNTTNGQVVAGGKGQGTGLHQLDRPTDVLIDKETDGLIICEGSRVVRLSRRSGTTQGEILIDNIKCCGLAMNEQRYLYVGVCVGAEKIITQQPQPQGGWMDIAYAKRRALHFVSGKYEQPINIFLFRRSFEQSLTNRMGSFMSYAKMKKQPSRNSGNAQIFFQL
ncbi:unnamed protein product, partial [Rotaria socialis]